MRQRTRGQVLRRRDIADEFRRLRQRSGLTVEEVALRLDCPPSLVLRVESGRATLTRAQARDMLEAYGMVGDTGEALLELVDQIRPRNWWYRYAELVNSDCETLLIYEDEATSIRIHQPCLVPGLLQTEHYAWELMTSLSDVPLEIVERRVRLRMARQHVLTRDNAPRLVVVLGEEALRRPVGGAAVMREQVESLADAARTDRITLRIRPLDAGPCHAIGHTFHIFEFEQNAAKSVQLELLDRELFSEIDREVAKYERAFAQALSSALTPERSLGLLVELAKAQC